MPSSSPARLTALLLMCHFSITSEPQGPSRGPMSGFVFVVVFLWSVDAETFLVKNPEVSSDLLHFFQRCNCSIAEVEPSSTSAFACRCLVRNRDGDVTSSRRSHGPISSLKTSGNGVTGSRVCEVVSLWNIRLEYKVHLNPPELDWMDLRLGKARRSPSRRFRSAAIWCLLTFISLSEASVLASSSQHRGRKNFGNINLKKKNLRNVKVRQNIFIEYILLECGPMTTASCHFLPAAGGSPLCPITVINCKPPPPPP